MLGADVGLALTGVAGTDRAGRRAGRHGVRRRRAGPFGTRTTTMRLGTQREQIRQFAVINALDLLRRQLMTAAGI